ncbi:MAG: DEAD/DEAH box helicase [Bacteroidetes bacterium]|nr:DEAD/DEAH box helicase [Bacteroidota bacterium]
MNTFESLGLDPTLVATVAGLGFVQPTEIQEKAIPVLLQGTRDFIGLAQTGTGKTAAFGLPLLQWVEASARIPQALIICPTRELCLQITQDMNRYRPKGKGNLILAVYGGSPITGQIKDLRKGVSVVVATPGRLIDLIERKAIDLEEIKWVVLDEADEMLNMGFQEDIEFILKNTPNRNSLWLFSATMPSEIRKVTKRYMQTPVEVTVGTANSSNINIDHQYYACLHHDRYEVLKRIIDFNPGMYGIIFARTKIETQEIAEKLTREGYDIDAIHGDLTQVQRDKVMAAFRSKHLRLLVATDVAARGIDVKGITHVINYELPDDAEVYTHRSGRTGRAGHSGISASLVTPKEMYRLKQIERLLQTKFHPLDIPSGKDVCRKQFFHFTDKLLSTDIQHGDYETYLPLLQEKFAAISKEEILQRVASMEFDRFLQYYANAADLNLRGGKKEGRKKGSEGKPSAPGQYRRLFVNLGIKDGFYKASFLQFILDMSELPKSVLGRIDMKDMNSWIEIEPDSMNQMIRALDGKKFRGRKIRMNDAEMGGKRSRS